MNLGYRTFDYLPPDKTEYPFVYVGEQFDQDAITKTSVYGFVTQTIHVYNTYRKRRETTDMVNALRSEIRKLKYADNYRITVRNIDGQTIIDNSTSDTLLHAYIDVEIKFH